MSCPSPQRACREATTDIAVGAAKRKSNPQSLYITRYHLLPGAKLFYLSGMRHGKYLKREVLNLGRFISVMKFRPLSWRTAHGYLVRSSRVFACTSAST